MAAVYDRYDPAPSTPSEEHAPGFLSQPEFEDDEVSKHEREYQAVSAYASTTDTRTYKSKEDDDEYDPEAMLYRAADDVYSTKSPKLTLAGRILSWYKPVYDYKTPNLSDKQRRTPKYCGGRFKRWQFILLHILIGFLFLMIVFGPLTYFIFIPSMVQSQLNNQKLDNLDLQKMVVSNFSPENVAFAVKASMPAPFWLPITVEIGETDVQVHKRGDEKNGLVNVHIPNLPITLNKPLKVDMSGYVSLDHCNPEETAKLVELFSTKGLNDFEFQIRGKFPIKMFGITFYKGLPLYLNLGKINGIDSNLKSLLKSMPSFLKAQNMNSLIRQRFAAKDLISLLTDIGFPEIKIDALALEMNDKGVTVNATLWLENPTRVTIGDIRGLSFGIAVEEQVVARCNVRELSLEQSLQELQLTADITFDDPAITPDGVSKTISAVLDRLLATGNYEDLKVAVAGPVRIAHGDWVETITSPLALYLPMKELLDALQFPKIRDILTLRGVAELVGNTKLAANVLSDRIIAPVTIGLARILPLPEKVEIKYNVSAALYGGAQKTLGLDLYPITVLTSDNDMKIQTTVVIHPENSMPAAEALATALNPILAAVPQPSSIDLKSLSFFAAGQQPFQWSNMLFKDSTIKVPLPTVICLPCIVDLVTKNGTEIPLSINSLAIDQLLNAPGFSAQGSANIQFPPTLPELSLDIGYASLDLAVEKVQAASVGLPTGLKLIPNTGPMALNAQAVLSRTPELPAKLQNLVDSLLKDGSIPSSAGITNLMFGPSANASFVTFSKIAIELSTANLKDLVNRVMTGLKTSILKPGLVKVTGADLEIVKSTELALGLAADVNNPFNISMSLGNIDLDVLLDDGRLLSLALPPLKLVSGPGGLDIKLTAGVATGAGGMAEKIALLVNQVLQKQDITALFGITSLVLSPPGARGQVGGAVIDQLKPVKIVAPADLINEINPLAHPDTSPIDMSGLLPSADILSKLNIDLNSASLDTLPGATLGAAVAAGYVNPLALAAKVPFFQLTAGLGGSNLVTVQVTDITLVRGQGVIAPKLMMVFDQTDGSIPDKVAEFVDNFIAGHIAPSVNVKTLYFGSSAQDINDLLSAVDADLSPITDGMDTKTIINTVVSMLPIKLPLHVNELMSSMSNVLTGVIKVDTLPQKTLGLNANVGLKLPFALSLNVGYFASKVGINANPLLGLFLPTGVKVAANGAGGTSDVALNTAIPFEDDEPAQIAVGNLVANFFAGSSLDTSIDLGALGLGYSAGDQIQALSKVRLSIPLDALIAVDGPSDIFSLLVGMKPALGGATLETRPGNNLGVVVDMGIQAPFKIAANIGYVGAFVGLNTHPLLDFLLPSGLVLDATGPTTRLNLNTELKLTDNEATQDTVAQLVNNFMTGQHLGAVIGLSKLAIGANQGDLITALSRVEIPADLERGLGVMGIQLPFSIGGAISALNAQIHRVKAHTAPAKSMELGANADFNLPFPVSLRLGYAALSAKVNRDPLADVVVGKGISIATNNSRAALNLEAGMTFTDTDATQTALASIVDGFVFSGDLNGATAGINKVFVGNSANEGDRLTVLNKVDVNLDIATLIKAVGFSIPMDITQLANSVKNLGTVNVETQPGRRIVATAGPDFNLPLPFPVDLSIGHVAAKADLGKVPLGQDGYPLLDLALPGGLVMDTTNGTKRVNLNADLHFTDTTATQEEVAKIVSQALGANAIDSAFGAKGIQIGYSATDLITAFNKVAIRLDLTRLLNQMGVQLPLKFGQVASNLDLKVANVGVETAPQNTIAARANLGFTMPLPISLTFKTGYFFTRATVGEAPLLRLALTQPLALTSLGDKRNNLNISTNLVFIDNEQTQENVASLVDRALNSNRLDMSAGVDGLVFGSSASDADVITVLAKAKISLGLDDLTSGLVSFPLDLSKFGSVVLGGGTVDVGAVPNKSLNVSAAVDLGLPFDISAKIGYLSSFVGVSAQNSGNVNDLVTFSLANLALGGKTINLATVLQFIDTEATQTDISTIVTEALNGPELNGRAGLNRIKFGFSQTDYLTVLNKVDAKVKLAQVLALAGMKVPIELGQVAGKLNAKIADVSLETLPTQRLAVGAKAGFTLPFRVNLNLPHLATEVGMNSETLLSMALPVKIAAGQDGASNLDVNTTIQFYGGEGIKTQLNNVVNHILSGKEDPAIMNLRKVAIGFSATDVITAFSKIDAPLKLDTILPGLGIKIPLGETLKGSNFFSFSDLTGDLAVGILPNKVIRVDGVAGVKLGFNVLVKAGWAGADVSVNNAPLARAGLPVTIAPNNGVVNLALNTSIQIIENDSTPAALAKAVNNYFGGGKLDSTAGISNLQFGFSQTDVIEAFSGINAAIPLDTFVGSDRFDIGKLLGNIIQSGNLSAIQIRRLLAGFTPDNLLNLGLGAVLPGLNLPIKLAANVPYVRAGDVKMDKVPLVDMTMTGVSLTKAMEFGLDANVKVQDSDKLAEMVADYVMQYATTKRFPGELQLGGLVAGATPSDAIAALSQCVIPVRLDPVLQPLLAGINLGQTSFTISVTPQGVIAIDVKNPIIGDAHLAITKGDVEFKPAQAIDIGIGLNVQLGFPLTLDIPYFAVNLGLDRTAAMDLKMTGLKTTAGTNGTSSALALGMGLKIHDSEELAMKLAVLFDVILRQGSIQGNLILDGLGVGASADNYLRAFSKAKIPIPFDTLLGMLRGITGGINIGNPADLIKALGLRLSNIVAKTEAGRKIHAGVSAGFSSNFPFTIKGLNYFALSFAIDESDKAAPDVFDASITGLSIAPGANNINIGADLHFPASNDVQDIVARFFDDMLKNPANMAQRLVFAKIVLGVSQEDSIKALSKARVGVAAKTLLGGSGQDSGSLLSLVGSLIGIDFSKMTPEVLMSMIDLRRAILDLGQPGKIIADVDIGLKNLTLNADIDLGYVSTGVALNGKQLAGVELANGVKIKSNGGALGLALLLEMNINDTDEIADIIANIVNHVLAGTATDDTAGVSQLVFGVSKGDSIDTFSKALIGTKIQPFIDAAKKILEPIISNLMSMKLPAGWGLDGIDVDAVSQDSLSINIAGHSPNNGQFGLNLPYAELGVAIDNRDFVFPLVENIALKDGQLGGHVGIKMLKDAVLVGKFGPIFGDLVFHRPYSAMVYSATVKNILFGTRDRPFKILSKVAATIQTEPIFNSLKKSMDANVIEIYRIQAEMSQRGFDAEVFIPLNATLPLNLKFQKVLAQINYKVGGKEPLYHVSDIEIWDMKLDSKGVLYFKIAIITDVNPQTGLIEPLYEALQYLFTWKSFSQHAYMGYAKIQGSSGATFDPMDQLAMLCPDLTFWEPLHVNLPVPVKPIQSEGLAPLPFGVELWWPNYWSFHLDIGTARIDVKNGGKDLIRLATNGKAEILNAPEGGATKGTRNFVLSVLLPFDIKTIIRDTITNILNPLKAITEFFDMIKNLFNPKAYSLAIVVLDKNNQPITWFTQAMSIVFTERFLGNSLLPILAALLTKTSIDLFGKALNLPFINFENLPFIKPLVDEANKILGGIPQQVRIGPPQLGGANFMAAGTPQLSLADYGLDPFNVPANFSLTPNNATVPSSTAVTSAIPVTSALPSATPSAAPAATSAAPAPVRSAPAPAPSAQSAQPAAAAATTTAPAITGRRLKRRVVYKN
ncbi:uncharacterized protein SPPG_05173 [Spizellomyces punctatus DAOM BR117]|uniref:Uncharacterized protein n=1 Tax=Spizellomyces punctatus (strain DAOM BR117) TaxID=645134 RepID=A0A0L0HF99_SPIPD|nr:uncharacterized protein SPPG_05173 [Spizellomyces punctatus DAOM BR117]KNC99797.1 hypothetical protein SPPG_05173 [Spizellomyces punctatus DAOM BR117]|eukprot:XP_016607837.1 hypothetical protein SPPG_05173 [Spizellomyces punctatus DAOM BR117]